MNETKQPTPEEAKKTNKPRVSVCLSPKSHPIEL